MPGETDPEQRTPSPILIKILDVQGKENIFWAFRHGEQGKKLILASYFSIRTYKTSHQWKNLFKKLKYRKSWKKGIWYPVICSSLLRLRKIVLHMRRLTQYCIHESFPRNLPEEGLHPTQRWLEKRWSKDWFWSLDYSTTDLWLKLRFPQMQKNSMQTSPVLRTMN